MTSNRMTILAFTVEVINQRRFLSIEERVNKVEKLTLEQMDVLGKLGFTPYNSPLLPDLMYHFADDPNYIILLDRVSQMEYLEINPDATINHVKKDDWTSISFDQAERLINKVKKFAVFI